MLFSLNLYSNLFDCTSTYAPDDFPECHPSSNVTLELILLHFSSEHYPSPFNRILAKRNNVLSTDISIARLDVVASTSIEWLGIHLQAGLMIHDSDQCTIQSVTVAAAVWVTMLLLLLFFIFDFCCYFCCSQHNRYKQTILNIVSPFLVIVVVVVVTILLLLLFSIFNLDDFVPAVEIEFVSRFWFVLVWL